jgi:hypothetical protein
MKNEFPIWGIKPNEKIESLLYTKCISYKEAFKILELLENKYKCTNCRIQILDLNAPIKNDFINAIN